MDGIIYKYMPLREEFFDNRLLRFTPRLLLNDPFEVRPSFSQHAEFVHRVNNYGESVASVIEEMEKNQWLVLRGIAVQHFDIFGILSLTERVDNLLMWAHYANHHTGIVVGFDPNHEFFDATKSTNEWIRNAANDYIGVLKKVRYSDKRKIKGESLDECFFLKSNDWWTEREWRYVLPIAEADEIWNVNDNEKQTMALYRVPPDAIVSVTFGVKVPDDTIEELRSNIIDNEIYKHVKLYQAKMCNEKFDLIVHSIDEGIVKDRIFQ
ncbi:DUF2971 domain-containing protein [Motiliproteus coralliicola]|uniref:DUF2971 domain-containing protein n=1 Tax=Motiliproteus coralliicola TaxID=2283196 RepID=A0A369WCC5_9GAMM|nr:DUF2971 domain-containing protein [Motiliproteus coralliicola]RDE18963.1 DUF2971 domain-containing protein [Motiliproteus coralliicola]